MGQLQLILNEIEATVGRPLTFTEKAQACREFKDLVRTLEKTVAQEINAFVRRKNLL